MAASDGVAMTSVFPRQAGPGSAGWAARCRKAGVPEDCDEAKLAFAEHGAGPGGGTLILHGHWLALTGTDWHWLALAGTGRHSLGICTVDLPPSLPLSAGMTASPRALLDPFNTLLTSDPHPSLCFTMIGAGYSLTFCRNDRIALG